MQLARVCRQSASSLSHRLANGSGSTWRTTAAGTHKGYATEQASGPGLPGQKPMSEEDVNRTGDRPFQGDKVENVPRYRVIKPEKEQPAAEDINQGTGSERIQTPSNPGRPQDSSEPVGSPM